MTPNEKTAISKSGDQTCILWDLSTGEKLACLVINTPINDISFFPEGIFLTGYFSGETMILNVDNQLLRPGRGIITVRYIWDFEFQQYQQLSADCPLCGYRFTPSLSVLDTIENITKKAGLKPGQSPCLELPSEVWEDIGLLGECPECGEGVEV